MEDKEKCVFSEYVEELILKDFEEYLCNENYHSLISNQISVPDKVFSQFILDGPFRILKWYKKYPEYYILGVYNKKDPKYESLIFILNKSIIEAYKTLETKVKFSSINFIDPITENNPLDIYQHSEEEDKYYLNYKYCNEPRIVEINMNKYKHICISKLLMKRDEINSFTLSNVNRLQTVYFRNISIETLKDFVSVINDSAEPMEVIWTGELEFPNPEFGSMSNTIKIELNIPVHTKVKTVYDQQGYLHIISKENAFEEIKQYLDKLFSDPSNSINNYFRIAFIDNYNTNIISIMLILRNTFTVSSPYNYQQIIDNVQFKPITVSHPFAVDFGLHIVGLEPPPDSN
jgi:hypothetical protein